MESGQLGQVLLTGGQRDDITDRPRIHLQNFRQWLQKYLVSFTLFARPMEVDRPPRRQDFDRCYSFAFIVVAALAALLIACVQWEWQSSVLITYMSDNPVPRSDGYSCSCALPEYLKDLDDIFPESSQVKACYQHKSPDVETVTVISFPNSTAQELLQVVFGGDEEDGANEVTPVYKILHDSYLVTNSLSELDLWIPDPQKMLAPLYEDFVKYFSGMEVVDMGVEEILNYTLFPFPSYYMLMMVQFSCVRYASCSPSVILAKLDTKFIAPPDATPNSTAYVANDWLTCGGYDGGHSWDPVRNLYHGRCMIYPTYPTMDSRVKRLLSFLRYHSDIKQMGGYFNKKDVVTFISRMEQVNQSRVSERQPMLMGYLEVEPGSPKWFRLADSFLGARFECLATSQACVHGSSRHDCQWAEVCNASSVCLSYKTAADVGFSSVRMRCMDFDRYNYTNCVVLANTTGNIQRVDDLCNPDASCKRVPSRKIKRQVKYRTELNNMNVRILESEIKATAKQGVCRNTYRNVVRYYSEYLNKSVLLETNCSKSADLCTLTGRYNLLDDEAGIDRPRVLDDPKVVAAAKNTQPFTCYGPGRQKSIFWAVTTAGVISGWISSMHFVAEFLYTVAMRRFLPDRED